MKIKLWHAVMVVILTLPLWGAALPEVAVEGDVYPDSLRAWPGDPTVNVPVCTTNGTQEPAQICSDGAGGAIIVWRDDRRVDYDIYAQRISAGGVPLWANNGTAICTATNKQDYPQLCPDSSGGAIIVWQDLRNGNYDIYAQRLNAAGIPQWTDNGTAVCTATNKQEYPQLCPDGSGGAIIAWDDSRNGANTDIYAQRVNSAGAPQWTADGIAVSSASEGQSRPVICSDGSGGAVIAWEDMRPVLSTDVYTQRVNATGVPQWTDNGTPVCRAGNNQAYLQICSDGSGGAIITWVDNRQETNFDIYAQRVSTAGTPQWTDNGTAVCNTGDYQAAPQLCPDGSGGAIISWDDDRNGTLEDIYAQRVNAAGVAQWTDNGTAISSLTNRQTGSQLCPDGAGGAIITWSDARSGYYDIFAQRVNAAGLTQWTDNGTAISTAGNHQSVPQICSVISSGAVIIWSDFRSGTDNDIYAQRVSGDGSLGGEATVAPTVTTDNATNVNGSSAVLNGTLDSFGAAASIMVSFDWGLNSGNYTDETAPMPINDVGLFSANLTGLSNNTTYHFRAKATGDNMTGYGEDKSFTTSSGLLLGDANGDGRIDATDITKTERIIVHLDDPTPGADANQDGNINALDVTKVERLIAGVG
ncbi:MAG: dockerin type I domain-containing protein [Chloroflexota bacterium]